ncbi:unnamed protein product [Penicillium crustosum]
MPRCRRNITRARPVDPEAVWLLCEPPPADLPTVDKELLILMAARSGNIDRYTRLRRPTMIHDELPCVIRGIYHHPFFAQWWLTQEISESVRQVIYARLILNNDLSLLNDNTPDTDLPVLIWFPKTAATSTYTDLNATPYIFLWRAGERSRNSHYLEKIEQKATDLELDRREFSDLGLPIEEFESMWPERPDVTDTWPMAVLAQEIDPMIKEDLVLVRDITIGKTGFDLEGDATPSLVENLLLNTCLADPSIRPSPPFQELDLGELYRDAPYVESEEDRKMLGLWPNPGRPRGGYRQRGCGRRG